MLLLLWLFVVTRDKQKQKMPIMQGDLGSITRVLVPSWAILN